MARSLGPRDFGTIMGLITGAGLLVPVCTAGVAQFWLQAYGEEGVSSRRWLPASTLLLAISTILTLAIVLASAHLSERLGYPRSLIIAFALHVFGLAANELVGSQHQIDGKYHQLALIQFTPHLARLVLVASLSAFASLNLEWLTAVYALVGIGMVIGALVKLSSLWPDRDKARSLTEGARISAVVYRALPFGLAGLFHLIYFQSSISALNWLSDSHSAGQYSAAFGVIAAVYLIPGVLYQKFLLPKIHFWGTHDRVKYREAFSVGSKAMAFVGCAVGMVLAVTAPYLMRYIFGEEYSDAAQLLRILSLAVPFMFVSHSAGVMLVSPRLSRLKMAIMGLVALANICVCITVIPQHGATGAAWATLGSNAAIAALYFITAKHSLSKN